MLTVAERAPHGWLKPFVRLWKPDDGAGFVDLVVFDGSVDYFTAPFYGVHKLCRMDKVNVHWNIPRRVVNKQRPKVCQICATRLCMFLRRSAH